MLTRSVSAFLIILQALVAFSLGVFGNKLAEVVHVSSAQLVLGIVVTLALTVLTSVQLDTLNKGSTASKSKASPIATSASQRDQNSRLMDRIITTFPVGMLSGIVIGLLCVAFSSAMLIPIGLQLLAGDVLGGTYVLRLTAVGIPHAYEWLAFLLATIWILVMLRSARDRQLVVAFCSGLAVGISGIILVFLSHENPTMSTLIGWQAVLVAFGLIVNAPQSRRIAAALRKALVEVRSSS